jgi:DNA-3-methyladenine glycosylase II
MPPSDYQKAQRHLARRDPVLRQLIKLIGPCTLWHNPDGFAALARSIVAQQISTKAAAAISARLEEAVGRRGLTPRGILKLSDESFRAAGLSAGKVRCLRDLADKVKRGVVPLQAFQELSDEEVIERLIPVHGIGRWTAEMFLIFSLGRLDVLPAGDYGLRMAVQRHYNLPEPPPREPLLELAAPWQPFRSIATWYMWRSLGTVPQSDGKKAD